MTVSGRRRALARIAPPFGQRIGARRRRSAKLPAIPERSRSIVARLAAARRAQGVRAYDVRVFVSTLALLRYLHRLARARRGRGGATVATSMPQLVAGLAPIMGWERSGDRFADRDAHHSSVRRWLRWLRQAAGLIAVSTALNDAGEEARTEITLLDVAGTSTSTSWTPRGRA